MVRLFFYDVDIEGKFLSVMQRESNYSNSKLVGMIPLMRHLSIRIVEA